MFQELLQLASNLKDAALKDPDTKGPSPIRDQAIKKVLFSSPEGSIGGQLAKMSLEFSGEMLCRLKKYKAAQKASMFTYFETGNEHYKALFLHAQAMILQATGEHDKSIAKNSAALHFIKDNSTIESLICDALINSLSAKGEECSTEDEIAEKIREIVQKQTLLTEQDSSEITPLHIAAYKGQIDSVKKLLKDDVIDINQQIFGGYTALHLSVAEGHYEVVNLLLQHSSLNIQITDHYNHTALELSIIKNRLDMLESFADRGVDLKKQDYLDLALEHEANNTILFFYSLGLNVDLVSNRFTRSFVRMFSFPDFDKKVYSPSPNLYKILGGLRLLNDLENLPEYFHMNEMINFLLIETHKEINRLHKSFETKNEDPTIMQLKKNQSILSDLKEACKIVLSDLDTDSDKAMHENFLDTRSKSVMYTLTCGNKKEDVLEPCVRSHKSIFKDTDPKNQILSDATQLLDDLNKFQNQLAEDSLLNDVLDDVLSMGISGEDHTGTVSES